MWKIKLKNIFIEMEKEIINISLSKEHLDVINLTLETIDSEITISIKLDDLNYDKSKKLLKDLFNKLNHQLKEILPI